MLNTAAWFLKFTFHLSVSTFHTSGTVDFHIFFCLSHCFADIRVFLSVFQWTDGPPPVQIQAQNGPTTSLASLLWDLCGLHMMVTDTLSQVADWCLTTCFETTVAEIQEDCLLLNTAPQIVCYCVWIVAKQQLLESCMYFMLHGGMETCGGLRAGLNFIIMWFRVAKDT